MFSSFLPPEESDPSQALHAKRVAYALPEKISKARNGSLEDLAFVARTVSNNVTLALPIDIVKDIVDLATLHLSKDPPSDGDYSGPAIRMGTFACYYFIAVQCVLPCRNRMHPGLNVFHDLWAQAFAWAQYLHSAIRYIHSTEPGAVASADSEISRYFAEGISAFMEISAKWTILAMDHLYSKEVFDFLVAFWATKGVPLEISNHSTKSLVELRLAWELENSDWRGALTTMQSHFKTAQEVALLVIDRPRLALSTMDAKAMISHYSLLSLLTLFRSEETHTITEAILAEKPLPFTLTSMSAILEERNWKSLDRDRLLKLVLRIILSICTSSDAAMYIREGFNCGLLETYSRVGQEYNKIQVDDASTLFVDILPVSVLSKSVLQSACHGFLELSRKLGNRPFNVGSLQKEFGDAWTDFEACILQHVVLQHIHARGIQANFVYCNNSLCPIKDTLKSFRKCAGCKVATYCSQLCQRTSWTSHHRLECEKIRRENPHCMVLPRCDESYLLYWVIAHLRTMLPSLRETARVNHPNHSFDQLALCANVEAGGLGPVNVTFHPLVQVPCSTQMYDLGADSPHERHFQNCTLERNERGEKDATMLMIRRKDGQSVSTKIFVVSLDKSAPRTDQGSSGQINVGENDNPVGLTSDLVDDIVDHVQMKAQEKNLNVWKAKFIGKYVDKYLESRG